MFLRAAQVFAYLLTRGHWDFQRYNLSETLGTIKRWATRFSVGEEPKGKAQGGRPEISAKIACLIVTLKKENPGWGQRRIRQELRRMGIRVSEPTIKKVLELNGFPPYPKKQMTFEIATAAVKDALWALDFFAVRTAKGKLLQVLFIADIYTREIIELRVHDGWDVGALWTICTFNAATRREGRAPKGVVHDHGLHFRGQFEREMRVQEIEEKVTPARMPWTNCFAERPIYSVRRELLNHLVVRDAEHLQALLDDYRAYANRDRAHQGLDGRTPLEASQGQPKAEVLDLAQIRARKLRRRSYAHGLLNGYDLVPAEPAGPPNPKAKAA